MARRTSSSVGAGAGGWAGEAETASASARSAAAGGANPGRIMCGPPRSGASEVQRDRGQDVAARPVAQPLVEELALGGIAALPLQRDDGLGRDAGRRRARRAGGAARARRPPCRATCRRSGGTRGRTARSSTAAASTPRPCPRDCRRRRRRTASRSPRPPRRTTRRRSRACASPTQHAREGRGAASRARRRSATRRRIARPASPSAAAAARRPAATRARRSAPPRRRTRGGGAGGQGTPRAHSTETTWRSASNDRSRRLTGGCVMTGGTPGRSRCRWPNHECVRYSSPRCELRCKSTVREVTTVRDQPARPRVIGPVAAPERVQAAAELVVGVDEGRGAVEQHERAHRHAELVAQPRPAPAEQRAQRLPAQRLAPRDVPALALASAVPAAAAGRVGDVGAAAPVLGVVRLAPARLELARIGESGRKMRGDAAGLAAGERECGERRGGAASTAVSGAAVVRGGAARLGDPAALSRRAAAPPHRAPDRARPAKRTGRHREFPAPPDRDAWGCGRRCFERTSGSPRTGRRRPGPPRRSPRALAAAEEVAVRERVQRGARPALGEDPPVHRREREVGDAHRRGAARLGEDRLRAPRPAAGRTARRRDVVHLQRRARPRRSSGSACSTNA